MTGPHPFVAAHRTPNFVAQLARQPKFRLDPATLHGLPSIAAPATPASLNTLRQQAMTHSAGVEPEFEFLLHHATMGFSLLDYYTDLPLGWNGWLNKQLDPASIDDSLVDSVLAQLPTLTMTPSELIVNYPDQQVNDVVFELQFAVFLRAIYSKRQLFERMVTFWTDHFNVSQLDGLCLWSKTDDDREVIRKHALGTFPEMLHASARSSSMLWYLDNYANVVGAAQENYARELLELHTLGVDGPYTEDDVKEVARCFTGWTFGGFGGLTPAEEFAFVPALHDFGPKTVLGVTIPAGGGIEDGEQVLDILANHPATAEFIARKMCKWLLMYEPPTDLVRKVSQVYLHTSGDVRAMIRLILDPGVVLGIPREERTKLRQPLHYMIALMRATLAPSSDLVQLTFASQRFGQTPYWWLSPDGPPDTLAKWGGSVLPRWEFASLFFGNKVPGNAPEHLLLHALIANSPGETLGEQISFALTGGRIDAGDISQVDGFFAGTPHLTPGVIGEAFALAASSPGFQFI